MRAGWKSACCPICEEDIGEGFFEVVAAWNTDEDWTRAVCPACGRSFRHNGLAGSNQPGGFSQIGFAFWGLNAELTEDFVDEFAAELGEPVRVVEVALFNGFCGDQPEVRGETYGRLRQLSGAGTLPVSTRPSGRTWNGA